MVAFFFASKVLKSAGTHQLVVDCVVISVKYEGWILHQHHNHQHHHHHHHHHHPHHHHHHHHHSRMEKPKQKWTTSWLLRGTKAILRSKPCRAIWVSGSTKPELKRAPENRPIHGSLTIKTLWKPVNGGQNRPQTLGLGMIRLGVIDKMSEPHCASSSRFYHWKQKISKKMFKPPSKCLVLNLVRLQLGTGFAGISYLVPPHVVLFKIAYSGARVNHPKVIMPPFISQCYHGKWHRIKNPRNMIFPVWKLMRSNLDGNTTI